jgi:hypothetical protein
MSLRTMLTAGALLGLPVAGLAAPPVAADAGTAGPAPSAAAWVAGQLVDGNHLQTIYNGTASPAPGPTADAVLALDAAKVGQDAATRATAWLLSKAVMAGYLGDGRSESYAGAHAKLALVAQAQGVDPTAVAGRDLIGELRARQAKSGRFSDKSQYGDFSNAITQSLAILALHRAGGAAEPAAAVDYLAGSRCSGGGFPQDFGKKVCVPDADATGFAVQALLVAGRTGTAGAALDWLASVQKADGGFGGSGPTAAENSNSTALAALALRAGGRTAAADRAVAYLTARQVGCGGKAANRGAVAYDVKGFAAGTALLASVQAVPALAGTGLAEVSSTGAAQQAPPVDCTSASPTASPATGSASPRAASGPPTAGILAGVAAVLLAVAGGLVLLRRQRRAPGRATGP